MRYSRIDVGPLGIPKKRRLGPSAAKLRLLSLKNLAKISPFVINSVRGVKSLETIPEDLMWSPYSYLPNVAQSNSWVQNENQQTKRVIKRKRQHVELKKIQETNEVSAQMIEFAEIFFDIILSIILVMLVFTVVSGSSFVVFHNN